MGRSYTNCGSGRCNFGGTLSSSDFKIKQGDTCPDFRFQIKVTSTNETVSYEGWSVEVYMFFYSYLRSLTNIEYSGYTENMATLKLLGNQNFGQIKLGDIIGVEDCDQNRQEFMQVISINYDTYEVFVERGYGNSDIYNHKKSDKLIFYRIYGKTGYIDSSSSGSSVEDVDEYVDDNSADVVTDDYSIVGYHFCQDDTSHKGSYFIDFKLSMAPDPGYSGDYDCGVKVKSYPNDKDGYVVNII